MSKAQDRKQRNNGVPNSLPQESPKLNPKDSMGSEDSNISYETHDVDNDRGYDQYKFSLKGFEDRTSVGSYGEGDSKLIPDQEDFDALDRNPIFTQLCPKDQYHERSSCNVCGKPFNKLKLVTKKHCKFCGESICEDHGRKRRPDPKNTSNYVRICDTCDEKFIQRTILKEFRSKLSEKEDHIKDLERRIRDQQNNIANVQKDFDDLCLKKAKNDKNYSDQMNFLTGDIAKIKEETKKCEKENTELTKEFNKTQKKVEELDNEIQQAEKEYDKLSKEAGELTHQIEALNQDIAQMNRTIRNIEECLTQNKSPGTMTSYDDSRVGRESHTKNESVLSSATTEKRTEKGMKPMRGVKQRNNQDDTQKSGTCNTGCSLF